MGDWETMVGNCWETLVRDRKYYGGGKYCWEVGVAKNDGRWWLGNGSYKAEVVHYKGEAAVISLLIKIQIS